MRVLTVLMMSMSVLAPYIPPLLRITEFPVGYSLMEVSNPFKTLMLIGDTPTAPQIGLVVKILLCVAGAAIFVNLRSMYRGVAELVSYDAESRPEEIFVADPAV
ncbi:MAG: hypothetical protein O3A00_29070 [Planctomycetota bacterium]|nr:hypothetical protein [Planctomycetota bacterium]